MKLGSWTVGRITIIAILLVALVLVIRYDLKNKQGTLRHNSGEAARLEIQIADMEQNLGAELQEVQDTDFRINIDSSLVLQLEKLGAMKQRLNQIYNDYPDLATRSRNDHQAIAETGD